MTLKKRKKSKKDFVFAVREIVDSRHIHEQVLTEGNTVYKAEKPICHRVANSGTFFSSSYSPFESRVGKTSI